MMSFKDFAAKTSDIVTPEPTAADQKQANGFDQSQQQKQGDAPPLPGTKPD